MSNSTTATFIMPHWRIENKISKKFFDEAIASIKRQTDLDWELIIIDDASSCLEVREYLDKIERENKNFQIIRKKMNTGAGHCRNMGIQLAYQKCSPFVLFIDADDIIDERRLEITRKIFNKKPEASVIYSSVKVIDENNNLVPWKRITPSIQEILEVYNNPPQGRNIWITIGTETGYVNISTSTSVRTELAHKYPFPHERVSEDSHTWMRYSAGGEDFVFTDEVPSLYRIPQNTDGSSSRSRVGTREKFYSEKARVDYDGFNRAMEIAISLNKFDPINRETMLISFFLKLGETLTKEGMFDLADEQFKKAHEISFTKMLEIIKSKNYSEYLTNYLKQLPPA